MIWDKEDGKPLIDYSSQKPGLITGIYAESIDLKDFKRFLNEFRLYNFDIMLEIRDKESRALKALK